VTSWVDLENGWNFLLSDEERRGLGRVSLVRRSVPIAERERSQPNTLGA
jgi:hypothetical protein